MRYQTFEIEWVFDPANYRDNPLWTQEGRKRIRHAVETSSVPINFICADFFIENPLFRCTKSEYAKRVLILKNLIGYARDIGAQGIEIPFVDNAAITTVEENHTVIKMLHEIMATAESHNVEIGLETSLPPISVYELLETFHHPLIVAAREKIGI